MALEVTLEARLLERSRRKGRYATIRPQTDAAPGAEVTISRSSPAAAGKRRANATAFPLNATWPAKTGARADELASANRHKRATKKMVVT